MEKEYKLLQTKVEKIEKEYGSLKKYVVLSTCQDERHKMRIGKAVDLSRVYEDLKDLEEADLIDYQNLKGEYGERL